MSTKLKNNFGFTLVELLIVLAILSILVSIALVSFRSSQARARDGERKSDLKQIQASLELFYSDYGKYPDGNTGLIEGCSYNPTTVSGVVCTWGSGEFTDGKTLYFKDIPGDPVDSRSYLYRIVDSPTNQKFQLFAALENTQDKDCLDDDCENSPVTYECGTGIICNFAVTSSNTDATE